MTIDQIAIFSILVGVLALFAWGRIRYDVVAFLALMVCVTLDLVPASEAFLGFAHPATVTVAMVLIISAAISHSGAVDLIMSHLKTAGQRVSVEVATLSGVSAMLSTVMNNVGALALMLPVALQSAAKAKRSPAIILMPMSFASILGGLVTLIGTPPNIIVSAYRSTVANGPFTMFDFAPVGGVVAIVGVVFVALVGWRLIPAARRERISADELFAIDDYIAEAGVPDDSEWNGRRIRELGKHAETFDARIVGLVRGKRRLLASAYLEDVRGGDILIIEAGPAELDKFLDDTSFKLVGGKEGKSKLLSSDDTSIMEAVVQPRSAMEGRTSSALRLRSRWGVNLLAVSRQGNPIRARLGAFQFQPGDVLLLQGTPEQLTQLASSLGCLPLAERGLKLGTPRRTWLTIGIFATAIIAATIGLTSLVIALSIAVLTMVVLNVMPLREIYQAVDWPIVILLGAMIPVGGALEATDATVVITDAIATVGAGIPPSFVLIMIMVITMTLSDIMNNAATAVIMAPISVDIAETLSVSADPFLMAVAIGASSAFLTPIGHQNNTLILGPGGYQFGDYWRMGLPLEVLIVVVSTPLILVVWPL